MVIFLHLTGQLQIYISVASNGSLIKVSFLSAVYDRKHVVIHSVTETHKILFQNMNQIDGEQKCQPADGYNIVVVDYITGELVSCSSVDSSQLDSTLSNIPDNAVVIIATQNVYGR